MISHQEIVQDVFTLNLKAYVDTNVTCKKNLKEALDLLELSPNFDIIVTQEEVSGEKAAAAVRDFLKKNGLEIPVIILGTRGADEPNLAYVEDTYDIKSVVKAAAKFLEITPRLMVSKPMGEFYSIPISTLKNMVTTEFEIFVREAMPGSEYHYKVHIKAGGQCKDALGMLQSQGVRSVYVHSNNRLHFINDCSNHIISVLSDENATDKQVLDALEAGHEIFAQEMATSLEMTEQMIVLSQACVTQMENVVKKIPNLRELIEGLVGNKSKYSYKHSIIAAYVANYMIENINWGSQGQAEKIAFVFFFHDIFLAPIVAKYSAIESEEELLFSDNLTDQEKDVILTHAFMASELVKGLPDRPMGTESIILQHHGSKSGKEFAVEFPAHIAPLSKVAIIAEKMTERMLVHLRDKPDQAFDSDLHIKALGLQFPEDSYKKLLVSLKGITL